MQEQLISFETAKLANKKGFFEFTEKRYNKKGTFDYSKSWSISASTQSLLQKWLREEHNIHVTLTLTSYSNEYMYEICRKEKSPIKQKELNFTYEEALEKGLLEGLKLVI
jgi:hypothetical protein